MIEDKLIELGYYFTGDCMICQKKYRNYENQNKPGMIVKVRKIGGYAKLYKGNQQVAVAGILNIEEKLKQFEMV